MFPFFPLARTRSHHLVPHCFGKTTSSSPPPLTKPALTSLLRSSSNPNRLKQIHALILTTGLSHKNSLLTHLLYSLSLSAANQLTYARNLFDEMHKPRIFLWNTLIRGYVKNALFTEATDVYKRMRSLGVRPDSFTFPFVLKSCAELLDTWLGVAVHAGLVKFGLNFNAVVVTELMVMYAKFGDLESADNLFDGMVSDGGSDLVSWNALISAYSQNGHASKALEIFRRMESAGVEPDSVTLVCVLSCCAYLGCLEFGKQVHLRAKKFNVFVENALLDMYSKCGSMDEASKLFAEMHHRRNVISWSTMIGGYAINGGSQKALWLLSQMREEGVEPNYVTMLAVLSACSHGGLVNEGKRYFFSIARPRIEHYASMVDLLGRSGHLEEAYSFIQSMPIELDAGVWGALLGACTIHHNTELGQLAADKLFKLASDTPSYQVLLSNMYAASGRWDDVEKVREHMRGNQLKKVAAFSCVELDGEIHVFFEGSHTWCKEVYEKLDELIGMVKGMGYVPRIEAALHDVDAEEKETAVRAHSEKLAVAFSLIGSNNPEGPLRIMKNLRICSDCHSFCKFVSRAVGREIVMRDKSRFHHFRDGECSCGDFW